MYIECAGAVVAAVVEGGVGDGGVALGELPRAVARLHLHRHPRVVAKNRLLPRHVAMGSGRYHWVGGEALVNAWRCIVWKINIPGSPGNLFSSARVFAFIY